MKQIILSIAILTAINSHAQFKSEFYNKKKKAKIESKKPSEKKDQIIEKTKNCIEFDGLFKIYQSKKDGKAFLEIDSNHLNKEFIYFSYFENGVGDAGVVKGRYRGSKIIKISKFYEKIDIVIENTKYYFDKNSALSKASNTNINTPIIISEKIIATGNCKSKFLISADNLFLNESFQQVKYSYPKTYRGYRLGSISKTKTRYDKIKSYPENTDVVVNYVFENKYPSSRGGSAMTDSRSVSIKVQHSLVELPDSNYVPRKDDTRVGFSILRQTT